MKTIKWSGQTCDFCGARAEYDAPMLGSKTWANACLVCATYRMNLLPDSPGYRIVKGYKGAPKDWQKETFLRATVNMNGEKILSSVYGIRLADVWFCYPVTPPDALDAIGWQKATWRVVHRDTGLALPGEYSLTVSKQLAKVMQKAIDSIGEPYNATYYNHATTLSRAFKAWATQKGK